MRDLLNGLSVMSLLLVVALAGARIFNDGSHSTPRGEQQEAVAQEDDASAAKHDDMNDDRETEVTTIPVSGGRPEGQPDNTAALEANMRLDDLSDFGAPSHLEKPPAEKPSVPDAIALLERLNRHFND